MDCIFASREYFDAALRSTQLRKLLLLVPLAIGFVPSLEITTSFMPISARSAIAFVLQSNSGKRPC